MRQLELFSTAELTVMRDRTASRRYCAAREEFRREHARRRMWGLARRHAAKLRRLHEDRGADRPAGAGSRVRPRAWRGLAAPAERTAMDCSPMEGSVSERAKGRPVNDAEPHGGALVAVARAAAAPAAVAAATTAEPGAVPAVAAAAPGIATAQPVAHPDVVARPVAGVAMASTVKSPLMAEKDFRRHGRARRSAILLVVDLSTKIISHRWL
ncbi:hypothetical protein COUCH_11840 [Couchioplanes caeruleus]|uniref:hypothetical protein n=1 Tax=Couchioplanes caeruleus TaxID=56438 RepID=UPI0020BF1CA6|nr:hypothetical protein [Couchioplanes caeruleus]UQU66913.1 hypothetical protein COUCH_11840 [Couchioplanes caeruleus]